MGFAKYRFLVFHLALVVARAKEMGFPSAPGDWGLMNPCIVQMFGSPHFAVAVADGKVLGFSSPRGLEDHGLFQNKRLLISTLCVGCRLNKVLGSPVPRGTGGSSIFQK